MAFGLTKDVTSISRTPAAIIASMNSNFFSVGMKSFTLWKPSRGQTSRICARFGNPSKRIYSTPSALSSATFSGEKPSISP